MRVKKISDPLLQRQPEAVNRRTIQLGSEQRSTGPINSHPTPLSINYVFHRLTRAMTITTATRSTTVPTESTRQSKCGI